LNADRAPQLKAVVGPLPITTDKERIYSMTESFQSPGDHYELAERLEASGLLQNGGKLQAFACCCCRLIWKQLSPEAKDGLKIGEDFSKGLIHSERIVAERFKLWDLLGEESCNLSSRKVNAVRAVICCLFEYGDSDLEVAYDHVRASMDFCNAVEDHQREQYDLLVGIFAESAVAG
jgi:hypothetical protein